MLLTTFPLLTAVGLAAAAPTTESLLSARDTRVNYYSSSAVKADYKDFLSAIAGFCGPETYITFGEPITDNNCNSDRCIDFTISYEANNVGPQVLPLDAASCGAFYLSLTGHDCGHAEAGDQFGGGLITVGNGWTVDLSATVTAPAPARRDAPSKVTCNFNSEVKASYAELSDTINHFCSQNIELQSDVAMAFPDCSSERCIYVSAIYRAQSAGPSTLSLSGFECIGYLYQLVGSQCGTNTFGGGNILVNNGWSLDLAATVGAPTSRREVEAASSITCYSSSAHKTDYTDLFNSILTFCAQPNQLQSLAYASWQDCNSQRCIKITASYDDNSIGPNVLNLSALECEGFMLPIIGSLCGQPGDKFGGGENLVSNGWDMGVQVTVGGGN